MKTFGISLKYFVLLICACLSLNSFSLTIMSSDDFNTNFGIWTSSEIICERLDNNNNNNNSASIQTPYLPITLKRGDHTTFQVSFSTSSIGIQSDEINITPNTDDESLYRINIATEGSNAFFDSDGDGVYDNVDLDDDNDGIPDSIEENNCHLSISASQVDYKFLEESFGQGNMNNDTQEGEVASWADQHRYTGGDHTSNQQSRMAMFNASHQDIFYTAHIRGVLPNIAFTYSFWALNFDTTTAPNIATRLRPNIKVEFKDMDGNILINTITGLDAVITTGDISPSINGDPANSWHQFTASLAFNTNQFQVIFSNNEIGGEGNYLAIDDIEVRQTLCDTDGDGIADVFDLDSDNDGIPDAVEVHTEIAKLTEGKGHLGASNWKDDNNNGMHDAAEGYIPIDTDGDGIPDYLDLDSDNDSIFDVDEYGSISSSAPKNFQNGDGDITGDGVGNGLDTEAFRKKDSDGNGTIEYYGDGILDVFDFHHSKNIQTYANSYGNIGQGAGLLYALDSDGDGIPDYRDPTSNRNGHTYDIDNQEIYAGLPQTNGVLDDTIDADGDGIMASRDGNDTIFGSPRNLNNSYSLYFDGRNDYVEDANVISSSDATLMAFIKIDGNNSIGDSQIIAGQHDFYIRVNTNNTITAIAEGVSLNSTSTALLGIWMHVAVTTTSGRTVLYINGVQEASNTNGTIISSASNFMIGSSTTNTNYFKGEIDEVRVFDVALPANELKRMVYQELDEKQGFNQGKIIPIDISSFIGANLVKYYKMDGYQDDILDNKTTGTLDISGAKMYNFKDIYFQRAPLPYQTIADGNWTDAANWLYGNQWDIATKQNNPDGTSIVHIKNNISLNGSYNTQGMIGLIVDSSQEFTIEADKGLYNSWYLELNGLLDLEGDSQLIQTEGSILRQECSGVLERDQQGNSNTYIYNYWASPVGMTNNTTNNNNYTVPNVISNVGFLTSGYNGSSEPVIKNADYWIWKYAKLTYDNYNAWQHVRSTGTMEAGQGFTMKGPGTATEQNYVFLGKPYNGDIKLPLAVGNEYLVGNPYASTIDADAFIKDNIKDGGNNSQNVINGAIYFWDHFANNTHSLGEYEGGYATYTLMGSTLAIYNDTRIKALGTSSLKIPERYIPVGQGFFVNAISDPALVSAANNQAVSSAIIGGDIIFKNSQRVFATEATTTSIFMKSSSSKNNTTTEQNETVDVRKKIKLYMNSPKGYHRQLLVGVDENASNNFDIGYDAPLIENNKEDMFWVFNDANFIIQAVNNFDTDQKLPLGLKINKAGLATIKIDALENIEDDLQIYLYDKELNIYHNLNTSDYEVYLTPGNYLNRFEITFSPSETLGIHVIKNNQLEVLFSNDKKNIVINNPNSNLIESVEMFNILGQSLFKFTTNTNNNLITYKAHEIKAGHYIIKIQTEYGKISKKVLIK